MSLDRLTTLAKEAIRAVAASDENYVAEALGELAELCETLIEEGSDDDDSDLDDDIDDDEDPEDEEDLTDEDDTQFTAREVDFEAPDGHVDESGAIQFND